MYASGLQQELDVARDFLYGPVERRLLARCTPSGSQCLPTWLISIPMLAAFVYMSQCKQVLFRRRAVNRFARAGKGISATSHIGSPLPTCRGIRFFKSLRYSSDQPFLLRPIMQSDRSGLILNQSRSCVSIGMAEGYLEQSTRVNKPPSLVSPSSRFPEILNGINNEIALSLVAEGDWTRRAQFHSLPPDHG